jgi:hypothetical protein
MWAETNTALGGAPLEEIRLATAIPFTTRNFISGKATSGVLLVGEYDGLATVGGSRHHSKANFTFEQAAERTANDGLLTNKQNANGRNSHRAFTA